MPSSADLVPFLLFFEVTNTHEYQRTMPGGWADRHNLPKGPNGRNLCRWCNLEVPKGRVTFCSAWCVEEWRLRSDPGYIREKVLERDRGVCAGCGVDCLHAELQLKRLRGAARLKAFLEWGLARRIAQKPLGCRPYRSGGGRRRRMRPREHPHPVPEVPSRGHRRIAHSAVERP